MRSFELDRTVIRSLTPKWDLSCVRWFLTKAPYEPFQEPLLSILLLRQFPTGFRFCKAQE